MTGRGIDTIHELSAADLDQLASLGYTTVCRYGSSPGGMDKDIKQPEFTRIVNHPVISLCSNWEDSGAEYEGGFAAGQRLGARARAFFRTLGWPEDRPIYFSSEGTATSPMTAAKLPLLLDYHRGINSVSPRGIEGMYGPGWAGAELLTRGLISHFWQWKDGAKATVAGAHVRQRYPTIPQLAYSHDTNDLLAVDHGQWNATRGQEEDVPFTPDDVNVLREIAKETVKQVWAYGLSDLANNGADAAAGDLLRFARTDAYPAHVNTVTLVQAVAELTAKVDALAIPGGDEEALRRIVREEIDATLWQSRPPS